MRTKKPQPLYKQKFTIWQAKEDRLISFIPEGEPNKEKPRPATAGLFFAEKAHPVTKDLYKRGIDTNTPEILEKVGGNSNLFED